MRIGTLVSLAATVVGLGGCGGGSATHVAQAPTLHRAAPPDAIDDPMPEPERQPLEVLAATAREGTLLRVDVTAVGRGHEANEEFEVPASWQIEARISGEPLKVLLRGPVRVERAPAGARSWNIDVAFSVYFALPGADKGKVVVPRAGLSDNAIALALTPPGEDATRRFQMAMPAPLAAR